MKSSIRNRLEQLDARLAEVDALLAAPETARDGNVLRALSKERADIEPVVSLYADYRNAEADLAAADELARDAAMREFADDERAAARARMEALSRALATALLPKDADDARNVFVEIRAGTGGEESALFAADLLRMSVRYAERHGFKVEDRKSVV